MRAIPPVAAATDEPAQAERAAPRPIYLSPPDVGALERQLLLEAFESNWIAPVGPDLDAFEREVATYLGLGHAAALASGTAALHLALRVLGVGPADEVLVSTLTFAATANAVTYVGATPVFVDSDASTWQMDPDLLEHELERRARRGRLPKAIIVVDLYGQCADYGRIAPACARFGVSIIEDAAEALGATYGTLPAGSLGDLGAFSFNGNKIVTTSGGGMLVSDRADWIERTRFLATQARDEAPHYEHSVIGYNYRLSNLLAAVGRAQLRTLDARVRRRRAVNAAYRQALADVPGISFMPEAGYGRSSCWLTCITVDPGVTGVSAEQIRIALAERSIETRPVWKPMHVQPVFRGCQTIGGRVAEGLFAHGLCLPSGSNLTDEQQTLVIAALLEAVSAC